MRFPRKDSPPSSTTAKNTNPSLAPPRHTNCCIYICFAPLERRLLLEPLLDRELHELRVRRVRSLGAIAARAAASASSVVVGGTRAAGAGSFAFADGAAGAGADAVSAPKPPAVAGAGGADGGGC